jgi:hypothetical protein
LKAVRACRRYGSDPDAEELPVRFAPTEDGGVSVGVGGVKTCGYWHSCPVCSAKIAVGRAEELDHLFRVWNARGGSIILATFTLRHHLQQHLRVLVAGMRQAWEGVRSGRPWRDDLDALGVPSLPVPGSDRRVRPIVRAFEVTNGDEHGHHPHYHVFLLVDGVTTDAAARAGLQPAWDRWSAGLAAQGMSAVADVAGEAAGFDVRVVTPGASGEAARYPFKLALEGVGGVFKRGRETDAEGRPVGKRHRTPFEIMEAVAVAESLGIDDELARRDREIVREWCETAVAMRFRQCPWPPGLRAWAAAEAARLGIPGPLLDTERTDEELAEAEESGAETAGYVGRRAYESVVVYELDTLRAAGRDAGLTGVVEWFDVRGLPFEVSTMGQVRLLEEQVHPPPRMVVRRG